jgi:hypothetical protein
MPVARRRTSSSWLGLVEEAFRSRQRRFQPTRSVVGATTTIIPLAVGLAAGRPTLGLFASLGSLNVALEHGSGTRRDRLRWGCFVLVGSSLSVLFATWVEPWAWASVVVAFAWIALWTMFRSTGSLGAGIAFIVSAVFVIANGQPGGASEGVVRTIVFAAGGLMALVVFAAPRGWGFERTDDPAASGQPIVRQVWNGLATAWTTHRQLAIYALALGAVVATSTGLYRQFSHLAEGYWIPLAALAVLQPDEHGTRLKAIQRSFGTLVGIALAAGLLLLSHNQAVLVAGVFVAALALFGAKDIGYHWFVAFLTPTVIMMLAASGANGTALLGPRLFNNFCGMVLALLAALLFGFVRKLVRRHRTDRARP